MTPYEAVLGRAPPILQDYLAGSSPIAAVDEILSALTELIFNLHENLKWAHVQMCNQVNSKRIDIQFQSGYWVLLKLQSFRQVSLVQRNSHKLARRFYGPFQITEKIGAVAYWSELPTTSKLHNVFHVTKFKRFVGDAVCWISVFTIWIPLSAFIEGTRNNIDMQKNAEAWAKLCWSANTMEKTDR